MSRIRVYIKTFDEAGVIDADFTEITDDVALENIGMTRQILDDDEYDVGVLKNSDFNLELRNDHGKYSEVGGLKSIFKYKRSDSIIKLTWQAQDFASRPGWVICGACIAGNDEVTIFEGLLSDEGSDTGAQAQTANFRVLGKESIFARAETPFSSLSNGDLISAVLFTCLNQSIIADVLTIDALNIDPGLDIVLDDVSDYRNSTVKDVLDDLLLISNSVLFIRDNIVYVTSRAEGATVAAQFYGQASNDGLENIVDIEQIKSGVNKTFNFLTWRDTALVSRSLGSIDIYGIRAKELFFDAVTDNTRRQEVLDSFSAEFGTPKKYLVLTVRMTAAMLSLLFLDKVTISYPPVLHAAPDSLLPLYGVSRYGEAKYPFGEWSLTIRDTTEWKIMGRSVKNKEQLIEFTVREV